jgi:serine phosphatase RsbU (regulator of sigma subunit)
MFRKLSIRLSFVLILILGLVVAIFTIYLVNDRSSQLKDTILNKGIASAKTGAKIMSKILDNVVDNKIYTKDELFNFALKPIPLKGGILASYRKISLEKINEIQKYGYVTGLDKYLDSLVAPIQDEFFKDPQVVFAVLCDNNGYTPTHNAIYNKELTGNWDIDNENSRSKRIFYDPEVARNKDKPYIFTIYHRDTGEEMWRISAPVFVKNRHWGSFRIGFSMLKTQEAIYDLQKRLIILMSALLLITVLIINRATAFMMKPLDLLYKGVEKVAKGDLSFEINIKTKDEIGELADAFNKMTSDLKKYIMNLQEATVAKEKIQSELKLGKDIQRRMLPHVFPPFPNRPEFDIYGIMEAAKEVAGDFYDFFFINDDNFCFVISDVSGKGVPSALFMVITKTLIKAETQRGIPIEDVLYYVNNSLAKNNENAMFATLLCGVVNIRTNDLLMVNAGHNPPIIGNKIDGYKYISINQNIALGVFDDFVFKSDTFRINIGDQILLYTDGVTEAFNINGEEFSDDRLLSVISLNQSISSMHMVHQIREEIKNFTKDAEQSDDITILAVTYHGNSKSSI